MYLDVRQNIEMLIMFYFRKLDHFVWRDMVKRVKRFPFEKLKSDFF